MLGVLRKNELSLIKDCKNSCLSFMTILTASTQIWQVHLELLFFFVYA